jgi:hypothetical protein
MTDISGISVSVSGISVSVFGLGFFCPPLVET